MFRSSIDLHRTDLESFCQKACGHATQTHPSRAKERLTGNEIFRLFDVRDDLFRRLNDAARKTGESKRSAHHLDEVAAAQRRVPLFNVYRKLAFDLVFELGGARVLLNAAPILLTALRKNLLGRKSVVEGRSVD